VPLPDANIEWPPPEVAAASRWYDIWGAWYSGDPGKLAEVYGTGEAYTAAAGIDPKNFEQGRLGVRDRLARMWHGTPTPAGQMRSTKLHMPLAGDIAATSADLLFGEPPAFVVADQPDTQARLEEYLADGVHAVLLEGGETCSGYGGVYIRIGWDSVVAEQPLWDVIAPDCAVPEWRSGRLAAVTFWRQLNTDKTGVWRHLERHEPGRVFHGLYLGTDSKLGRPQPLNERPETAPFATLVNGAGFFETGATGMLAEYIPNMRPNRIRGLASLGRSDYAGIEPTLDALDETWSSWMRDLRLAKARLIVPDTYLQPLGRGRGAAFDPDREIFTGLSTLPSEAGGQEITQVQFAIRVAEHRDTAMELQAQAVRGAGYSVQTFGETGDVAATATEVVARERRSFTTRSKKINYWRPALARLAFAALQVDVARFKPKNVKAIRPTIEWPDGIAVDPEQQARTLQLLHAAEVVSTRTRVQMLHPDWKEERVQEEVDALKAESQLANPDDMGGGFGGQQEGTPHAA